MQEFSTMFCEIQQALGNLEAQGSETKEALLNLDQAFGNWKPTVDAAVEDLRGEVAGLRSAVADLERAQAGTTPATSPTAAASPTATAPLAATTALLAPLPARGGGGSLDGGRRSPLLPTPPSSAFMGDSRPGPDGHRGSHPPRSGNMGVVTTLVPAPA